MSPEQVTALVQAISPQALNARRWFGGKGRQISTVQVRDLVVLSNVLALTLMECTYRDGVSETYFLPLSDNETRSRSDILAACERDGRRLLAADALPDAALGAAFLRLIEENAELPGQHGRFVFRATSAFHELTAPLGDLPREPRVLPPLQSNSLVSYNDRLLLKCFRKVEPGISPDLEVTSFLTQAGFQNIPRVAGGLEYMDDRNQHWPLAVLQAFVPNQGSAWQRLLTDLQSVYYECSRSKVVRHEAIDQRHIRLAHRLGERTAQMHVALASCPSDPDFVPELVRATDWLKWLSTLEGELHKTINLLRTREADMPANVAALCREFAGREAPLKRAVNALHGESFAGLYKTRFHGDYHLGQVLITGDDVVILDFEGEPMRPIGERRAKHLALKDAAGMLRSFNYAGFAALFQVVEDEREQLEPFRQRWEQAMRGEFLRQYSAAIQASPVRLAPRSPEASTQLLAVLELEKALYEVRYEINNRPDWVRIPLSGIQRIVKD